MNWETNDASFAGWCQLKNRMPAAGAETLREFRSLLERPLVDRPNASASTPFASKGSVQFASKWGGEALERTASLDHNSRLHAFEKFAAELVCEPFPLN